MSLDRFLFLALSLLLICAIAAYRWQRRREEIERELNAALDARTDALIRRSCRAMSQEEILALLEGALASQRRPIEPSEFVIPERRA